MTDLISSRLLLRPVVLTDLTSEYVQWLNDPAVNCYLETRLEPQSIQSVRKYWYTHGCDTLSPWWAICRRDQDDRHIGNIKLGPIHPFHLRGDISLFIGDRGSWGLGFATEAISLVRDHAFSQLSLHKLSAGLYVENISSKRAFEKCGFQQEAILKSEALNADHIWTDVVRLSLFNNS